MLIILKKSLRFWLAFAAMLLIFEEAEGQVRSYLKGTKTGNYFNANIVSLSYGGAGVSPMNSQDYLLGFKYFYSSNTTDPVKVTAAQAISVLPPLLGAGADAYIQFRNTNNDLIVAGKTAYFSIDKPLLSGVSVAVGGLLGIIEMQSITATGYAGAGKYALNSAIVGYNGDENTGNPVATTKTEMLLDPSGNWYVAATPTSDYNSVRLAVSLPADLRVVDLARSLQVNVRNAFIQTDGGVCNLRPQFTSPGELKGGINLDLGIIAGLGLSAIVSTPEKAINGNPGDFSAFSSGLASVGVANPIGQRFHFDHKATENDGIRVQLGIQQSLIDLDLLGRQAIQFKFYDGEHNVYSTDLASIATLLHLNLLNLITINGSTHKRLDFTFNPEVPFDRFEIIFDQGLANVGVLGDALRVYEVSMAPSLPIITVQPTNPSPEGTCEGGSVKFSVTATNSDGSASTGYQWQYLDASNNWVNAPDGSSSTLNLTSVTMAMDKRWYRAKITGGNVGCPQDIYSDEVQLTVTPSAKAVDIEALDVSICHGHSTTLKATSTTISSPIFKWYANADLTTNLATGSSYDVIKPTATTSYWVTVAGTGTCENAPNTAKKVTVTVTSTPPPHIEIH